MKIIADAATIVALIDKRDGFHQWTAAQAANLPLPFLTCEAVISECCYLLHHIYQGEQTVLAYLKKGILQIDFSLSNEIEAVQTLMRKYETVPMSLANACLVRMSELMDNSVVFTLDGDFHIYRKNGKKKIDLIVPE
ncbi:MAG: pilus assembly protein [Acidobacteriota bacterium]|nr:pilus assembly protein [Acidobacteriota bacterium]